MRVNPLKTGIFVISGYIAYCLYIYRIYYALYCL